MLNFGTKMKIIFTQKVKYHKRKRKKKKIGGLPSHVELMLFNLVQFLIWILTLISMLGNILEIIKI